MNACKDLEHAWQHRVYCAQECVGESKICERKNEREKAGDKIGVATEERNPLEHHINGTQAGNTRLNKNANGIGK